MSTLLPGENRRRFHFGSWRWAISLMLMALLILFIPIPSFFQTATEHHIRIEASQYQFTPSEIYVKPGERVTVELVSTDVVHGLSIDGYDFELTAEPGQSAVGSFVADKSGVFRFRCSIACGNLHPFMIGKMQVGPNLVLVRGIALGLLAVIAGVLSSLKKEIR